MVRVDLHTHSLASPDGGLSAKEYATMLRTGRLQAVAVTDHNRIDFAVKLQAELGNAIIVGEEISTKEGEIIGLFLKDVVPFGMTARETAECIHAQGGLVYIPHPFETARKGLRHETLEGIADMVDIVETFNGRTMQNKAEQAKAWAIEYSVLQASSSDAHGYRGWGNTASTLTEQPERETLLRLLNAATMDRASTGITGRLYPKFNRLKIWVKHA